MTNQVIRRATRIACSAMVLMGLLAVSASAQQRRYTAGITVFTNPNFTGQSVSFRDDMPDLRGYSLNDKISSLEIPNGESWELCQDINYANRCQVFSGSVSDLRSMGWNDRVSSLRRVGNGFRGRQSNGGVYSQGYPSYPNNPNYPNNNQGLMLFDRPNFRGNSTMVTSNTSVGATFGSARVRSGSWQLCDRTGRCATIDQDVSDLSRLGLTGRITSVRPVNGLRNDGWNNRDRRYGGR